MPLFDIICLANSTKLSGRCVAGLRTDGEGWMRPIAPGPTGELHDGQYTFADITEPALLDIVRIEVMERRPSPYQPENWLLGSRIWELVQRPAPAEFAPLIASQLIRGPALLGNTAASVSLESFTANPAGASLALVAPSQIQWRVYPSENTKRVRVHFNLGASPYGLPVTDPKYVDRLKQFPIGLHQSAEIGIPPAAKLLFTVSLSEPFNGACYKLVAAIVILPQSWSRYF